MSMIGIWGWDIDAAKWYKVGANVLGELLIDTDALETLIAARIPADIEDITFNVEEQGTPAQHCYGWIGDVWYHLLVESAANPNLRVKLYDGAAGITAEPFHSIFIDPTGSHALHVLSLPLISYSATASYVQMSARRITDGLGGYYHTTVAIVAKHGVHWDNLQLYDAGILKVGRAEVGLLTVRKTAVGQVGAVGARKLYWMTMNPSAANSVLELTDDDDGLSAVVFDMTHGVNASHHMNLDPPMEFANGIYIKTINNFTSVIFSYL